MSDDSDRTASLMTPAKLAQLKARPRPAASPAAWLDQLAADAGSGHARRLVELRAQLEAQARERDQQPLQEALDALAKALERLDFELLQPKGWLARATGRGKEEAAGFATQVERIQRAGDDLRDEARGLQRRHAAQAAAAERSLVEFEVEVRAIEKIMDQGARWLQDMRNQLKAREAQGSADPAVQQHMREDSARCELLVGRLKLLRAASGAAQQVAERCKAAVARRARLPGQLQQALEGEWKAWQQKLPALTEAARNGGAAARGVDDARAVHQALQRCIGDLARDCAQLAVQERALADELAGLRQALQDAA